MVTQILGGEIRQDRNDLLKLRGTAIYKVLIKGIAISDWASVT